jgi:hypothetical protein
MRERPSPSEPAECHVVVPECWMLQDISTSTISATNSACTASSACA